MTNLFYAVKALEKKGLLDRQNGSYSVSDIFFSLIKEIGSIVIGAYASALSMLLKRLILSPPPTLISGSIEEILTMPLSEYKDKDYAMLIEAIFEEAEQNIKGGFYLVLTPEAASEIEQACKKILEEAGK